MFSSSTTAPVTVLNEFGYDEAMRKIKYERYYEQTIAFIKEHEGFAGGREYECAAGYRTIGYGHVIKQNEIFAERISKKEADRLLRKDFDKALQLAKKHTNNLNDNQLFAIAHFIFAKGVGNFLRSRIKIMIDNGESPIEEFGKWCKYRKPDGTIVKSEYSMNIRKWEAAMYGTK